MKGLFIIILIFIISSCEKREWNNLYDPNVEFKWPYENWSPSSANLIYLSTNVSDIDITPCSSYLGKYDGILIEKTIDNSIHIDNYYFIDYEYLKDDSYLWRDENFSDQDGSLISYSFRSVAGNNESEPIEIHLLRDKNLLYPASSDILDNGCKNSSDGFNWFFDWTNIPGASKYHLYVISSTASNAIINKDDIDNSEFNYFSDGYVYTYEWKWKFRALINDNWTEWSNEKYFKVEPQGTDCYKNK